MADATSTHDEIANVKLEVGLLKRDISVFDKYFQKIDATLEKLAEATGQMTRMIALHEERLELNLRGSEELKKLNEDRREEILNLERKIDGLSVKLTADISKIKEDLTDEISKANTKSDNRIKKLEFWRYMLIGMGFVIMFLASNFVRSYFDHFWGAAK